MKIIGMMINNEEHNDEIGNNHIATNTQNPIRTDAFEISDEEKITRIKKDVENINDLQEKTQESCKNMDAHIDFVEKTYDYFTKATPLSYMSSFKEKLWPRKSLENKKEQ